MNERIDRGFGSNKWLKRFLKTQIEHCVMVRSDHVALILNTYDKQEEQRSLSLKIYGRI